MEHPSEKKQRLEAVALGYQSARQIAPRVLAKGKGEIAVRILEIAQANHVPIRLEPGLTQALMKVEVNEYIPEQLYSVVAQILAWVYSVEKRALSLKTNT